MVILPVGYYHSADLYRTGKLNLEPGLEHIMIRVKVAIVTFCDFAIYGKLWFESGTSFLVLAGGCGSASVPVIYKKLIKQYLQKTSK
jgi:hypothetical protein